MQSGEVQSSTAALSLKGRMYTALVLRPGSLDPAVFAKELESRIRSAPELFSNAPVVLDLQEHAGGAVDELGALVEQTRAAGCVPYAVQSPHDAVADQARKLGLAVFANDRAGGPQVAESREAATAPRREPSGGGTAGTALLVEQPVRSGQQVYARGRDLVVLASVSPGAEVLADGHIHIYGTLHGRALAGVQGDESARIFCRRLEAQLVAIAGCYRTLEEANLGEAEQPVQIKLCDGALQVERL